jgi:hypothetical protein
LAAAAWEGEVVAVEGKIDLFRSTEEEEEEIQNL